MPRLLQPAMVLNDWRMERDDIAMFQMWNSWLVPRGTSRNAIFTNIQHVAASAPEGRLRHLIFHGHGEPGAVTIGGARIGVDAYAFFKELENKVGHIWFISCNTAASQMPERDRVLRIARGMSQNPVTQQVLRNDGLTEMQFMRRRMFNGSYFCRMVALAARCRVTASTYEQMGAQGGAEGVRVLPYGVIDHFEGDMITWSPDGSVENYVRNMAPEQ